MADFASGLDRLRALPSLDLWRGPSPVQKLTRLRASLGAGPLLLIKRDDAIPFGFGGNKVRKIALVAARAVAEGADTLLSVGGVQSNSARVVACAAAKCGLRCVLVANGSRPDRLSANALVDSMVGAEVHYVATREERAPRMAAIAEELRRQGRTPFEIPLGASTPLGALGFAKAVVELVDAGVIPDLIVHSTSSGGTQAGLLAGCTLLGLPTRVLGISADASAADLQGEIREIIAGMGPILGLDGEVLAAARPIEVDDGFIGEGYGIPTPGSQEAIATLAQTEAIFLDPVYTSKAMAGLLAHLRKGAYPDRMTILFWHTGGQIALFA
jgi:1-aminocyclopropane-1-carboxylate deaminase/D-cysteine desulfhydrase-like pyridoxal-dependent ACC family enzyme